ncbi:DUF6572 domain-containing protein [Candidatus Odyssella thessalonicensis]|uniref:DUF6572 domain-containing protein n=1 Tax=Candidatus Odyssella thessalonicensis TaxID=84647 RepID=UPI000225B509|nr:DUF6572 domain-containing protein [Candidatus Odyssella thessalonicensis]
MTWIKKIKEWLFKKEESLQENIIPPEEINGDGHPIPSELVNRIDVITTAKDGNTHLFIVSVGYLDGSHYIIQRIAHKVNTYLCYINDDEFKEKFGHPSVQKTTIKLKCSEKPHTKIFQIIESLQETVNYWHSSLSIEIN